MIERLLAGLIVVGGLVFAAASFHRTEDPPAPVLPPAPAPTDMGEGAPVQAQASFAEAVAPSAPVHHEGKAHAGEHGKAMKKKAWRQPSREGGDD
jgi:hypothetical protein